MTDSASGARVLLAYFSRAGENYYYYYGGRRNLEVGNTEMLCGLIGDRVTLDVHRIEAAEPYSDDYDDTVDRNVREQNTDARPALAGPPPAVADYDVIMLASGARWLPPGDPSDPRGGVAGARAPDHGEARRRRTRRHGAGAPDPRRGTAAPADLRPGTRLRPGVAHDRAAARNGAAAVPAGHAVLGEPHHLAALDQT